MQSIRFKDTDLLRAPNASIPPDIMLLFLFKDSLRTVSYTMGTFGAVLGTSRIALSSTESAKQCNKKLFSKVQLTNGQIVEIGDEGWQSYQFRCSLVLSLRHARVKGVTEHVVLIIKLV